MCDCIQSVEKKLAEMNTAIDMASLIHQKTGQISERLQVKVRKADPKVRRSPTILVCTFCPFCGERIQDNGS